MTYEDDRARFLVAQHLLETGRAEEARRLLLALVNVPVAQAWAAQLERGEPIDAGEWRWLAHQPAPTRTPRKRPTQTPSTARQRSLWRLLILGLMMLSLVVPLVQQVMPPARQTDNTQARSEARARLREECVWRVERAIALRREGIERVGSCLDWSFSLPQAQLDDALRCHQRAGDSGQVFSACIEDAALLPAALQLP